MPTVQEAWLAAVRWQETGSPAGNYRENVSGCLGAYCWNALGNWTSMASQTGHSAYANTPPYAVPPAIQDAVAWGIMGPYVGRGQYAQAAELWNGGVPYPVPNPVLGSSAVYAAEVIAKFNELMHGNVPLPPGPGPVKAPSGPSLHNWAPKAKSTGQRAGQNGTEMGIAGRHMASTWLKGYHLVTPKGVPHISTTVPAKAPPTKYEGYTPPAVPHIVGVPQLEHTQSGTLKPGGGWVPAGATFNKQAMTQGQNFETDFGGPILAPGDGGCVAYGRDPVPPDGFGSPYLFVQIDSGPWAGQEYYIAYIGKPTVRPGQRFSCGKVLGYATYDHGGGHGWVQIGLAPGSVPVLQGGSDQLASLFVPLKVC